MRSTLSLLALASLSRAAIHEVWYNITETTANPDGLFERKVVGVNGTWPPPVLDVNGNDTVIVNVHNSLSEGTSIHHHGMFFNKTSYYDGAPGITQCPIPAGSDFQYTVDLSEGLQWGTYWWHSHVGSQYVDGMRAPFVIHPEEEVHEYDDEYTIVISDWYHDQHATLIKEFMNIYNPTGAEPVPDSGLIYVSQNGTYLPGFNENSTMTFVPGKTYRLRIINAGAFAMWYVWVDGHQMRVIEADGTDTEEYNASSISLGIAQRYSVLVTARNDTSENFYFHANFDADMFDTVPDTLQVNYTSNIVYDASSPYAAAETRDVLTDFSDQDLVPTIVEEQLVATREIELGVYFDTFTDGTNRAAFNNITFDMPTVPSIITQMTMGNDSTLPSIYGQQTHAYVLEKGEVVDLQIINWDSNGHPFHLHGHKYQIVRRAADVSSNDTTLNPPHTEGAANPMRRDTIVVPAGGAVNVRFVADNPGAWIFHCHIEWHLEAGLAVVFIEAPTEAQEIMTLPDQVIDQCAAQGIATSGNIAGKNSTTDLKGEALGPYPQNNGWHAKGIGAMAGCILTALVGMAGVVWYAFGGQLDAEDVEDEVRRELEAKKDGGVIKRGFKSAFGSKKTE
ncbi:laccase [Pseudohyphozyma bogoriensis]|nr:laccase [Pseudohyphozyma bogoriensis]